jgi:hypothetical protein
VFRFVAVSVFATGGSVSILQILLSPKSRLVIAIFPWFTSRGLRLLTRRIRVATARTKRGELLLLLKPKTDRGSSVNIDGPTVHAQLHPRPT